MALMREVEWGACLLEPQEVPEFARRFRRETGRPDRGAAYFAGAPWLEDVLIAFAIELESRVALDAELADLVGLVVSHDNSCRYCFAVTRAFLRILGMTEARISNLEQNLLVADFSPAERAALEFARRMSRSEPQLAAGDVQKLRAAGFDDVRICELVAVVAMHLFFNRLATLAALPAAAIERFPDRWQVRALRPLLARRMRRIRRHTALDPLRPEERGGPFAEVLVALGGIPLARVLHRALEGLWASPALPRRTKALVMAVVARALGCTLSEDEASRVLLSEGLRPEEIGEVLDHLDTPALDARERQIVSFSRDTVWYQPSAVQRRSRAVRETLSRDAFVELLVTAALANVLCRVALATQAFH